MEPAVLDQVAAGGSDVEPDAFVAKEITVPPGEVRGIASAERVVERRGIAGLNSTALIHAKHLLEIRAIVEIAVLKHRVIGLLKLERRTKKRDAPEIQEFTAGERQGKVFHLAFDPAAQRGAPVTKPGIKFACVLVIKPFARCIKAVDVPLNEVARAAGGLRLVRGFTVLFLHMIQVRRARQVVGDGGVEDVVARGKTAKADKNAALITLVLGADVELQIIVYQVSPRGILGDFSPRGLLIPVAEWSRILPTAGVEFHPVLLDIRPARPGHALAINKQLPNILRYRRLPDIGILAPP